LPGYQSFATEVTLAAGQKSSVKTHLAKASIHQADPLIDQSTNNNQANNQANHTDPAK